ncbi:hypothetical protein VFPBJ_04898 [Purpureocillium lilacinum]|nr:hypothetical protein VFPBJ_04898 [Purpureocillium lilacinum]GJN73628.1 hypothetical protein PLICBS_007710 [Purpureocillium lilacinum]
MSSRSRSSSASSPSSRRSRSVVGFFPNRMTFYAKESSGNWFSRYKEIQPHQWRSVAVRIMAYATGAPPNATVVKKKSRVQPETLEPMDGLAECHSRLFWITVYDNGEAMPAEMVEDIPRQNMHYEEQGAYASAPAGGHVQQLGTRERLADDNGYPGGGFNARPNQPAIPVVTVSASDSKSQQQRARS